MPPFYEPLTKGERQSLKVILPSEREETQKCAPSRQSSQPFRFLDLPQEMRWMIYDFAFVGTLSSQCLLPMLAPLQTDHRRLKRMGRRATMTATTFANLRRLLNVCSPLRAEVREYALRECTWAFQDPVEDEMQLFKFVRRVIVSYNAMTLGGFPGLELFPPPIMGRFHELPYLKDRRGAIASMTEVTVRVYLCPLLKTWAFDDANKGQHKDRILEVLGMKLLPRGQIELQVWTADGGTSRKLRRLLTAY